MRAALLLVGIAGCATSAADPAPTAAPPPPPAQAVKPLELAGPFASLQESCKAAPPCGFTDMDPTTFKETKPPKVPNCKAVLDPSIDRVRMIPMSISTKGGDAAMTHKTSDGEIRIGGVICAVPDGLRRDDAEYYVFVHRFEGWYRTKKPMFEYSYNNKYCSGGMYILWNDKPSRTIAGIAAAGNCLTCSKQGNKESIAELMLRVEMTGKTPAVYPFIPVGHRTSRYSVVPTTRPAPAAKRASR